jgi:hypothetical protein
VQSQSIAWLLRGGSHARNPGPKRIGSRCHIWRAVELLSEIPIGEQLRDQG